MPPSTFSTSSSATRPARDAMYSARSRSPNSRRADGPLSPDLGCKLDHLRRCGPRPHAVSKHVDLREADPRRKSHALPVIRLALTREAGDHVGRDDQPFDRVARCRDASFVFSCRVGPGPSPRAPCRCRSAAEHAGAGIRAGVAARTPRRRSEMSSGSTLESLSRGTPVAAIAATDVCEIGVVVSVAPDVDTAQHDLFEPGVDQGPRSCNRVAQRDSARDSTREGDDAVAAAAVASVLDLEHGSRARTATVSGNSRCRGVLRPRRKSRRFGDHSRHSFLVRLDHDARVHRPECFRLERRQTARHYHHGASSSSQGLPHGLSGLRVGLAGDRAGVDDDDGSLVLLGDDDTPTEKLGCDLIALDTIDLAAQSAKRYRQSEVLAHVRRPSNDTGFLHRGNHEAHRHDRCGLGPQDRGTQ